MLRLVQFFAVLVLVTCSPPIHHEFSEKTLSKIRATNGRLSGEVVPTSYTVNFRLEADFFTTSTYSGTETIALTVGEITTPDSSFQFHAKDLEITSLILTLDKTEIGTTFMGPDPDTDLITVVPAAKLNPGSGYQLAIAFNGELSQTSMVGLYLSSYVDDFKQTRYAVATQFEETHARKAFPCFDEPQMKATFALSVTYPREYHVWSNAANSGAFQNDTTTDGRLVKQTFNKSPPMSTYLVALVVSPYNCKKADNFIDKIGIQLCSEIAAMDLSAKLALDAAPHILERMSEFTGHNYTEINKLTLAAITDFAPGAMENWGLVTFKEEYLLWTEGESSNAQKQRVYTVLAHELSHQWFGDLVTLEWWSSMFLNEGFATYFEYHISDMEQPDWELTKQFVIEQLQPALDADSDNTALPLSYEVTDPDYGSRSNDLSYNKGGSILRMVHHFLTIDNYRNGIIDYISNNVEGSVTPEILWNSFDSYATSLPAAQKPPKDMVTVMDSWTKKSGYPLLTVTASGNDVIITQEEFVVSGDPEATEWYVPITYTTSADVSNFKNTATQVWLSPGGPLTLSGVLEGADWIVLNNQQVGYYRVDYDQTLLDKISNALNSDASAIDEVSRAQLVDDQFNLAKAGKKDYNEVINFLAFLKQDASYYSWSSAFNNFDYLLKRTASTDVKNALKKFIREQMQYLLDSVPADQDDSDNQIAALTQALAHTWACKVDHEDCILNAREIFVNYTNNPTIHPNPNMRSTVYCNGLRTSTDIVNDFRFLWEQYGKTKTFSEKVTILQALGCVNDETTREMYLSMVLTDPSIKLEDDSFVFSSVYSNNPEGVSEVLNFVMDNHKQLTDHFGGTESVESLISALGDRVTTQVEINKLQVLSQDPTAAAAIETAAANAVIAATSNLEIVKSLEETFTTVFDISTSSSTSIGSDYLINLVCVLIGYVMFNIY